MSFMLDGSSIAAEDTPSPHSINWDSTTATKNVDGPLAAWGSS